MMRKPLAVVALAALLALHLFTLGKASEGRKILPQGEGDVFAVPLALIKITSLEFDGLAADFLFLRSIVFYGETYERIDRQEKTRVKQSEWKWLHTALDASTNLDPYFYDPYYFATAILPWEGHLVQETNRLLEKGTRYRDWDWVPPFFMGFNQFYFLQENAAASESLMKAWRRPGAPSMLASLAARLAEKGKQTENAIVFLEELLKRTEDKRLRKQYETRVDFLKGALYLENAVARYRKRFGKMPSRLEALVDQGIISGIPRDPLGGLYYISSDGTIGSTSEMTSFSLQ
jgi:hypothetical protein